MSWSRPKQCYAIIPSITATQAHKYKDTLFGSLPCLIPIILPSLCVTRNTHSAPCKQVLFVLSDYKYCFGKIIFIKRRDRVYLSVHWYKTHRIALLEDIPSSFVIYTSCFSSFFFFGFSVKAQNLEWKGSRRSPSGDLPAPIGPTVGTNNTHTHTQAHSQINSIAGQYKKTLRNGETSSLSFFLQNHSSSSSYISSFHFKSF